MLRSGVPSSGCLEFLFNWYCGLALLERKMSFLPLDKVRAIGAQGWPIDRKEGCLREFWKFHCPW
jgi:hypothetical protein